MFQKEYQIIAQRQHDWVRKLERVSIAPIMVSRTQSDGITPSVRYLANEHDWWQPYQYRRCLDTELFYDIDERNWDLVRIYSKPLTKYLKKKKIPFILAGSGGKGVHYEIFFDALDYQKIYGFRQVREKLWHYILDEIGIDEGLRGAGQPYCNASMCFGDTVQFGKVIREFGASKNGKRKTVIVKLPRNRDMIYKSECVFPEHIMIWKVPIKILESLNLKARRKGFKLCCEICPVDRGFVYVQSHYLDDWGRLHVSNNVCTACLGLGD